MCHYSITDRDRGYYRNARRRNTIYPQKLARSD